MGIHTRTKPGSEPESATKEIDDEQQPVQQSQYQDQARAAASQRPAVNPAPAAPAAGGGDDPHAADSAQPDLTKA